MAKWGYLRQLMKEMVLFARQNRIYWILPLVLLLIAAAVIIFAGTAVAPNIYIIF